VSVPFATRELGPVALLLLVEGAFLYGSHILHGSFYYDDWANAAFTAYPPHPGYSGALQFFFSSFGFRPLLAFYVPTVHEILGLHQHLHIAWSVFLGVVMSAMLYATLRTLRLQRLHAYLIAALVLAFPFSDATIMWSTEAVAHLVITLYFAGLILALRGLWSEDRKTARLYHLGSLVLYVAAVTTYEVVATVALASVIIYAWQSDWRRALQRFALDVVAIGVALWWTASHNAFNQVASSHGGVHHAVLILGQGLYIIAETIIPFGTPSRFVVLGLAAAVVVAGAAVWRRLPQDTSARLELRRWVLIALAGPLWAYVAWATFVPADPYYEPTQLGVGNRTNVVAAIGLVAGAYASGVLLATILLYRSRARNELTAVIALAVAVVLGAGYARRISTDDGAWNRATTHQVEVLDALKREIPRPARASTVFAYGYPIFTAPGVPVFAASWDLNGAIEILYHDGTLHGYPIALTSMVCAGHSMYPGAVGYGSAYAAPYGRAYLLDVGGGRAYRPRNRVECDSAVERIPRTGASAHSAGRRPGTGASAHSAGRRPGTNART
jgi:hypothetical protein